MKKILLFGLLAIALGAVSSARAGVSVSIGLPGVSVRVGVPVPVYVAPPVYARPAPVYMAPPPVWVPPPRIVYHAPVCPPPVVYVPRHRHHPRLHVSLPLPPLPLPPFCR